MSEKTDWYCTKCERKLTNDPKHSRSDTVSVVIEGKDKTTYYHDRCGGMVLAGRSKDLA